jgi:hypothetical protein
MTRLLARLDKYGETILCGRRDCGCRLAHLAADEDGPYLYFDPGWWPDESGIWRLTRHARRRWQRGLPPRFRRPLPLGDVRGLFMGGPWQPYAKLGGPPRRLRRHARFVAERVQGVAWSVVQRGEVSIDWYPPSYSFPVIIQCPRCGWLNCVPGLRLGESGLVLQMAHLRGEGREVGVAGAGAIRGEGGLAGCRPLPPGRPSSGPSGAGPPAGSRQRASS